MNELDKRNQAIIERFKKSWDRTESRYRELIDNHEDFNFAEPILKFILKLKLFGYNEKFRIGTSMDTLVISRSVEYGLRDDQKEIRIECVNDLTENYEYNVLMRQGRKIYREYRVSNLTESRVMRLIDTLKETLID